jgi:hypothetical protein
MDYKRATINGTLTDIVDGDYYMNNQSVYANANVAMVSEHDGKKYVLPVRKSTDLRPGYFTYGSNCTAFAKYPKPNEEEQYLYEDTVIDFGESKTIQDIIEKQNQCRDIEYINLCNAEDIFIPTIGPDNTPLMKGFKEATISKHFDITKYKDRFGPNYLNDIRQYNKNDITIKMVERIADNVDMDVYVTFKDKPGDIPNPMGREITVKITGNSNAEEEE